MNLENKASVWYYKDMTFSQWVRKRKTVKKQSKYTPSNQTPSEMLWEVPFSESAVEFGKENDKHYIKYRRRITKM